MNKKGNLGLIAVILVLALLLFAIYMVGIATRDCNGNRDCAENAYCGTDYECHQYPEKIVVKENNFIPASLILGLALIIAVYIYRTGKIPFQDKFKKKEIDK